MENQVNSNETTEKKGKCGCQGVCQYKAFFISLLTSVIVVAIYHCLIFFCMAPRCPMMKGKNPCFTEPNGCRAHFCPGTPAPGKSREDFRRGRDEFRPAPDKPRMAAPEKAQKMKHPQENRPGRREMKRPIMPQPEEKIAPAPAPVPAPLPEEQ